jgi:hypothetical protein
LAKSTATAGTTGSLVVGAVTWFVLDVILAVALWISFVADVALAGGGIRSFAAARRLVSRSGSRGRLR